MIHVSVTSLFPELGFAVKCVDEMDSEIGALLPPVSSADSSAIRKASRIGDSLCARCRMVTSECSWIHQRRQNRTVERDLELLSVGRLLITIYYP